ncbi:zinc finger protein GLIS2 homolog isoform X1 [Onthophagus taurus]|uniref:zinc finger protein GLIS2 homolog isoform X1 n=2 Tax=Onthophagus taurus TaxID=166361 RepID=UPI0039BEA681
MYFEGRPLIYHRRQPNDNNFIQSSQNFSYFRPFEDTCRMSEEFMLPSSPQSTQSDSDTSISSIDINPKPIQSKFTKTSIESRCCWQNCGLIFETLERLSDHVSKVHAISSLNGLYYCLWDGCTRNHKGFNARYKMLVHVRTHTNEKPHQCTLCNKSFSRAENLKIHIRSHSGERPYVCPVPGCNKAYSNSSDRFKHTRTHQVDKPYQCKVPGCTKRYTDPSSLRKHVKTYKHFVEVKKEDETQKNQLDLKIEEIRNSVIVERNEINNINERIENDKLEENGKCSCDHLPHCYYSRCLGSGYVEKRQTWSTFIEPYLTYQQKDIELNDMDIDLPLDLSIRRHY